MPTVFIMKDRNLRILSTRPLDEALVEKASFKHITITTLPFIEIKKLVTNEVSRQIEMLSKLPATVVFTSMNAVEVVVDLLPANAVMPGWKLYCIGGATFTLVKKYWAYDSIAFTAKNATDLAKKITADKITNIHFFCGNKRREELPEILRAENIMVNELVVYETIDTPVKIEEDYNAILFFSPSAVNSFFTSNQVSPDTILFAIGNTTANAIKQFSSNSIVVSEFPARDQLVDKAIEYFDRERLR
ncbi:MAG: Uroporphyrinogen synthase [Segetibacter sp.]|nr:Uroporphyrinogen synthase [Segetibacter sp.]